MMGSIIYVAIINDSSAQNGDPNNRKEKRCKMKYPENFGFKDVATYFSIGNQIFSVNNFNRDVEPEIAKKVSSN